MDFSLDKLIRCPTKKRKTQKRKRDSSEAKAEKVGAIVVGDAPVSLEIIMEEVPGYPP